MQSTRGDIEYYQCKITGIKRKELNTDPVNAQNLQKFEGDPNDSIRKVNTEQGAIIKKRSQTTKIDPNEKKVNLEDRIDFIAKHPATGVEGITIWNNAKDKIQEDQTDMSVIPRFADLSKDGKKQVLLEWVKAIQNELANNPKYKNEAQIQGTTFCAAIVCGDEIHVVNVGDSRMMLVSWNDTDVNCQRLNTKLHNVKLLSPEEKKGRGIIGDRLGGALNLYRILGGTAYEKLDEKGPARLHEPDYEVKKADTAGNRRVLLLAMSDGAVEQWEKANLSDEKQLQEWFKNNFNKIKDWSVAQITEAIGRSAVSLGSEDNISIYGMWIDANHKLARELSVKDGNAGPNISSAVSEIQYDILNRLVQEQCVKEGIEMKAADEIKARTNENIEQQLEILADEQETETVSTFFPTRQRRSYAVGSADEDKSNLKKQMGLFTPSEKETTSQSKTTDKPEEEKSKKEFKPK